MDALQQLRDNLPGPVQVVYFDIDSLELDTTVGRMTVVQADPAVWRLVVRDESDEPVTAGCWHEVYDWLMAWLIERGHFTLLTQ